jgi:hypothetical protein
MARVTYESKDNAGHKFWVARYGRYAIRIDATRRGVYPWRITLEGRSVPWEASFGVGLLPTTYGQAGLIVRPGVNPIPASAEKRDLWLTL